MMQHDPHDMKAICYNAGIGEPFFHEGSVALTQVDADDPAPLPALQAGEMRVEFFGAFARKDIENSVVPQITKCR